MTRRTTRQTNRYLAAIANTITSLHEEHTQTRKDLTRELDDNRDRLDDALEDKGWLLKQNEYLVDRTAPEEPDLIDMNEECAASLACNLN